MAVRPTGNSRIVKEDIAFSKSIFKENNSSTTCEQVNMNLPVSLPWWMVLKGNRNYKTGRWIAFYKNDMEAVIDFGQPADFQQSDT